jgi:uncharacterized protein
MNFAINYSLPAIGLLKTGQIQTDYLKCPDWLWMIEAAVQIRPVAVHFNLVAGNGNASNIEWDHIMRCLETTGTFFVNLHLESHTRDFPEIPIDTTQPAYIQQVYDQALRDITTVVQMVPAERVIIENVPYRGRDGKVLRPSVEPELIRQILSETGTRLLFDHSHARISAHYMGIPEEEYIQQLPMERLAEMHFTGMQWHAGKLTDHLGAQEADWQALGWIFERIQSGEWPEPWLLAFEYGGVGDKFDWRSDPQIIAEQVPRLYRLCRQR